MPPKIPPPWLDCLRDVDCVLGRSIEVHCLGGFVLGVLHDLPRPTGDVDFVEIAPAEAAEELLRIAVPARSELRAMIGKVRSQARRAGVKPSDVGEALRRVRRVRRGR